MMNFVLDIENNVWQLAGWTMIHFAWIGTALLALVFLTRLTLRRAHPTWRYATTLLLFTALALSPLAIAGWLVAHWPATPVVAQVETPPEATPAPSLPPVVFEPPATEIIELTQLDDAQLEALAPASEQPPIIELTELPQFNEETTPQFLAPAPTEPATLPQNPIATTSSSAISVGFVVSSTPAEQFIAALDRASQYLPWFWLIGAPLTFALLATGLVGGERLRRGAELLTTGPIVEACEQLKRQLKITRRVVIAATDRVAQPVLVGIVRPMILLPWAALHGWRADQIEMVLLHELAHVRRWDNLVNLGQRIVESLLFYHPAVWLVSRWLRHDREECCDAVVVAHTGEPAEYAELLISVAAQLKSRRMPLAASAMAQHPLARRVRRLLQLEEDPMLVSRTSLLMGVAALVVAAVVAANYPLLAEDERPPAEGNAPAASVADEPADTPSRLWPIPYDVYAQEVEKAGRLVEPGEVIATLNEKLANEAAESNSPFLSLEDQRVADLAYNMLSVEVEPLTEELPPEGRERGFKGGVKVVQFDSQGFNQRRNLVFMEGDILVGLHVWPINDFDSLGEVLRRDDLEQYSPLKVYMLRPRSAGRSVRAARGEEAGSESESEIGGFELVTGRMSFDSAAWSKEQARLGNRSDVPRRQSSAGRRVAPGQAPPSERPIPGTDIVVIEGTKEGVEARVEEKLSQLRYDGRSFDEWRSQWRNELKVEERIEAIKAMTAFGRAGYGREAAEAIFDVAAQYDFRATSTTSPESGLVKAIRSAFSNYRGSGSVGTSGGAIAIDVWMNVLSERLESDRETYLPIAVSLLPHAQLEESVLSLVEKWSKSEDENLRRAAFAAYFRSASSDKPYVEEAFRRALVHEDRQLAFMALSYLISRTNVGPPGSPQIQPTVERLYPEVLEILFHPEKIMRPHARWLIAHVDDKLARRFAADLVKRLEGTYGYAETTDTRIAALRALGALGPRAQAAMKSLKDPKRLFDGPDLATRAALATALYQILGPKAAGDRQEMGEIAPIWDAMSEGLDENDSGRLTAKFMEDVTEIYPKGQIPPRAEFIFKYLKEMEAELEKADVPPPSEPPPAVPLYAPPPVVPDLNK